MVTFSKCLKKSSWYALVNSLSRPALGTTTSRMAGRRKCVEIVLNVQMLFWSCRALMSLFAVVWCLKYSAVLRSSVSSAVIISLLLVFVCVSMFK